MISEVIKRDLSEIIIYKLDNKNCKFASIHKVELYQHTNFLNMFIYLLSKRIQYNYLFYYNLLN